MSVYDQILSRSEGQPLVPEQVSNDLLTNLTNQSAALNLFRIIRMSTSQTRMPVLAALPTAYWVSGDTGLKQTTDQQWSNKFLNVEELAAIVPIPENVLADTSYDLWGAIRPNLENAFARAIDQAVFLGVNKPASWPNAIATQAAAVSPAHTHARNADTAAGSNVGGLADDFADLFSLIENDGYDVDMLVANPTYKKFFRKARSYMGEQYNELANDMVYSTPVTYAMRGLWTNSSGNVSAIAGNRAEGIIGLRSDFSWKLLDQAVIQDSTGNIIYNLAQQDMVALRVTFRCAFQVAATIRYDNTDNTNRYPFAVMLEP